MGKRIHWVLLIAIAALGLGTMIYFGLQPRPETRIQIRSYVDSVEAAKVLASELRRDIRQSQLLFLGIESDQSEHINLIKEFLSANREPDLAYELLIVDQGLGTEVFPEALSIATRDDFNTLVDEAEKALIDGKRVAVIVPTVFSSQAIPLNLVSTYKKRTGRSSMSLSVTDFPRRREEEMNMRYPCVVEGVDQTGLGPFGCMIATISRGNYRRHFKVGESVGILNQIGLKDFLFLYAAEK